MITAMFGTPYLAVIETAFDHELGSYVPARPLDDYLANLPFLFGRYQTHRAYSTSTVEVFLGNMAKGASEWMISELRSVVLLNRKSHFELRPLPRDAQLARVFGITVADFNLDGSEDIFLAQNFFANRTGVPRHDAGRGLMLSGDGKGGFTAVAGAMSGIAVYGEQRGAATADFDHDGRPDLAVTQNASETKLYRNQARNSGLRLSISGPPGNPTGIGCLLRVKEGARFLPARELHAGSGYWTQDSAAVVLAVPDAAKAKPRLEIELRWPGGARRLISAPANSKELHVEY
jgi:hypothetical protein